MNHEGDVEEIVTNLHFILQKTKRRTRELKMWLKNAIFGLKISESGKEFI